jgi:hypothetical protein
MARDKSYGSGYKNTGKADPTVGTKGKRKASAAELSRVKASNTQSLKSRLAKSGPDPVMGLGVGLRVLRGASAALAASGNLVKASMINQRVDASTRGRTAARNIAQFGGSRQIEGSSFARTDAARTLRDARTSSRHGSEAYPRRDFTTVGTAPTSIAANQKTPSSSNFYREGKRYVDTRYNFDPIVSPRQKTFNARDGYGIIGKKITGPKKGQLPPTGARYAPPRKERGGQR